jgi:hypothetical protein
MKSLLSDSLPRVTARATIALWLTSAVAVAAEPPPPPPAATHALPESVALPPTRVRDPVPEPDAIKVRIDGEYEARQSFLTPLPLKPIDASSASLDQTSRLFHWLRLRGLALFGTHWEVRGEADVPRGMLYGREPEAVPDNGTDFDRQQPVRVQPRMLRLTVRGRWGEASLGHTTTQLGMGLVDANGDQPRWFGTPDRPATYERLQLLSGSADSTLRVGASGDLLFDDGRLALSKGDHALRAGLNARLAPNRRVHTELVARYETLGRRANLGGAQLFLLDLSGGLRAPIAGRDGELFVHYEGAYRVGSVSEVTAFGGGPEQTLAALAFAARAGVSLERVQDFRRFAHLVASIEWGIASGDADPTDDELHRFVMNPNHGVGLLLFSEILRFKTSRAQALLERAGGRPGRARVQGLATGGGVASATTAVVDPSAVAAQAGRQNFDGGSPRGRALGSELDLGAELTIRLDAPMLLRLSVEGALAFPGSAFADADGRGLGVQAITTSGLGLTF